MTLECVSSVNWGGVGQNDSYSLYQSYNEHSVLGGINGGIEVALKVNV